MKHGKILSLVLVLALLLSLALPVSAASFDEEVLNRGDFVTLFYLLYGWLGEYDESAFSDVKAGSQMADAVCWASENGFVNGYKDGTFRPNDPITREQMAVILYRYAQFLDMGFTGAWAFPLDYPDADQISGYADEAMHWAVMNNIFLGTKKGLEPKANVTMDQFVILSQRWQKVFIGEKEDRTVWNSFGVGDFDLRLPTDIEFKIYNQESNIAYIGSNGRLSVALGLWDYLCEPDIEALAALAEQDTGGKSEILHGIGMDLVKVRWGEDSVIYFFFSPDYDIYTLSIAPDYAHDPDASYEDIAAEVEYLEQFFCRSIDNPDGQMVVNIPYYLKEPIDYLALVNKLNALPDGWEDSLYIVHTTNSLGDQIEVERTAYKAYLALKADVAEAGVYIDLDSARRSVAAQQDIMDRFIAKYGADYAAKTVAVPGYSEHHTGLALDLYLNIDGEDVYYNEDMVQYPEIWAKIHAKLAEHGFILRYLEDKEHVTGYGYEPWHIRYIDDPDIAAEIMEAGITLEEYLGAVEVSSVKVEYGESALYSPEELKEAAVQVKCRFASWAGCTLHSLRYAGDELCTEENLAWLNSIGDGAEYTQLAVFVMDYHSPVEPSPDSAWEPDFEYTDYQWWLGRTEDGGWEIVTFGY